MNRKYLAYLLRHRWFVMLACFREGLYWQGLIHDWSKFLPGEFLPYARYFYSKVSVGETIEGVSENAPFCGKVIATRLNHTGDGSIDPQIAWEGGQTAWIWSFEDWDRVEVLAAFNRAWLAHQHRNPHHWQHWVLREDSGKTFALEMPHKYRVEMLCDWQGAGRAITGKFNPSDPYSETREWYEKNAGKMLLHDNTRAWVQERLAR
jgi:hypothetical protein